MKIALFGSSLLSSYWNGAATYYRGIVRALHDRGHTVTFYEPDALGRQEHRDLEPPPWAEVVVYGAGREGDVLAAVASARGSDVVAKASGVGAWDEVLEQAVSELDALRVFWDVDAPATLARMEADSRDSLRGLLPRFHLVLTYGGGDPVCRRYAALGSPPCEVVYNALDPAAHHPAPADERFAADLVFLGNRLPDREERVEQFFLRAAGIATDRTFLLGGSGWDAGDLPANVRHLGHVSTRDHNALNSTPLTVLNVTRESMAQNGYSPATRVFEAAGAGACLITDAWEGVELFLEPDREVLVARDGAEVAGHLARLEPRHAREIGEAALARVRAEHTYARRAELVERVLVDAAVSATA